MCVHYIVLSSLKERLHGCRSVLKVQVCSVTSSFDLRQSTKSLPVYIYTRYRRYTSLANGLTAIVAEGKQQKSSFAYCCKADRTRFYMW